MSIHDDAYASMLKYILAEGDSHADRTGTGTTSVFGYHNRYDLKHGFPLLTTKRMAWRSIVVELAWFLLGRTDNQWLKSRGVKIWDEWATKEQCAKFGREEGDLGPIYGHSWRHFGQSYIGPEGRENHVTEPNGEVRSSGRVSYADKGDQIKSLCNDLKRNPNSRRLIVSGWNPEETTKVALPPCHTMFQCKVRTYSWMEQDVAEIKSREEQHLDLHLYQRSADCFLGVPFNIASYALLLQLLAHTHDMKPGRFIHTFGDLHIYNNHREQVQVQLSRSSFKAPRVEIPFQLRGRGFDGVMEWATQVGEAALHPGIRFNEQHVGVPVRLCDYQSHEAIKAEVSV